MSSAANDVLPLEQLGLEALTPSDWGVEQDCFVRLHELGANKVRMLQFAAAGATISWTHDGSEDRLVLTFLGVGSNFKPGLVIGNAHRWVPSSLRGVMPTETVGTDAALRATVRRDVVITPLSSLVLGSGTLTSRGYVGAWVDQEPVVECMDFALGRQYYNFRPPVEAEEQVTGPVIYLGGPRLGWGHFLTQGLARIWYALEHPDIPVLWNATRLLPYQEEVLDLVGLRNPQLFLRRPASCEQLIVPFPGLSVGDFALPEFARAVGRVEPRDLVPGKRLFISRSGLGAAVSENEARLDELATSFGFQIFRPEQHSVREQLDEMSSAEAVLGVEGSAFHTPLLLRDPLQTRFWALSRHRGGSGVFEHIRQAKGLQYETLNFLGSGRLRGHRSPFDLDLAAFEDALRETDGLTTNLGYLHDRIERPWPGQTSFATLLEHAQVRQSRAEQAITRAHLALRGHDPETASALLAAAI